MSASDNDVSLNFFNKQETGMDVCDTSFSLTPLFHLIGAMDGPTFSIPGMNTG